jgi:diaminopimelate decarboxylase
VEELRRIAARARALGKKARVSLRINPSVDIDSHSHIRTGHEKAKFGIPVAELDQAFAAIDNAPEYLECVGVSTHVGSMLTAVDPYVASARVVCDVAGRRKAQGKAVSYVDFGGGWGIDYQSGGGALPPERYIGAAVDLVKQAGLGDTRLVVEPGRAVVGPYGVLLSRVLQTKETAKSSWLLLDAGMNDLLRPALYGARHRIEPLRSTPGAKSWRVVGPVCESSDDFGDHEIGNAPDHVVVRDAGAYAFSMASEYNGRALPCEVFLSQGRIVHVARSPGAEAWVQRRLDA